MWNSRNLWNYYILWWSNPSSLANSSSSIAIYLICLRHIEVKVTYSHLINIHTYLTHDTLTKAQHLIRTKRIRATEFRLLILQTNILYWQFSSIPPSNYGQIEVFLQLSQTLSKSTVLIIHLTYVQKFILHPSRNSINY